MTKGNLLAKHLSDILQLPSDFTDESVTWDCAHLLELSAKYAKEGKKINGSVVGETKWLIKLDQVLQHIMKNFRYGVNYSEPKSQRTKSTFS